MNEIVGKASLSIDTVIGALLACVAFFVSRAFTRSDANRDDIASINQAIGLLNAAKERSKEKDAEQEKLIAELQKEIRELRERVLVMERDQED